MVSQLMALDDLTGHLTTNENRALMLDLGPHLLLLLVYKLRLLIWPLRRGSTADKVVSFAATSFFLLTR
jgi:hypothetical protein